MLAFVLITAFILYQALVTTAKLLNLRSLRHDVPVEFQAWYDRDSFSRSKAYLAANTAFNLVSAWVGLGSLLAFWILGGFERLDLFVRGFGRGPILSGLLYFALLFAAQEVLSLPFAAYHTFALEQRFGFNRTSVPTFAIDRLKEWMLTAFMGIPLAWVVLWLFTRFGAPAWVYVWLAAAAGSLALLYFAPKVVLPLFFRMRPLPPGEMRNTLTGLCTREQFPVRDLYVIDGSRRSARANAFFTGFGRNKCIALFDTLIHKHTVPELNAVLAHEIGHAKKGHIWKSLLAGQASLFCFFFLASWFVVQPALFTAFGVTHVSYYVGLVTFALSLRPLGIVVSILSCYLSRRYEFEADRFAAKAVGSPEPLISALKKLSKDNLANLTPHPLLVGLQFTHPPVLQRIAALRAQP
jgi:STE24 endopeptidase